LVVTKGYGEGEKAPGNAQNAREQSNESVDLGVEIWWPVKASGKTRTANQFQTWKGATNEKESKNRRKAGGGGKKREKKMSPQSRNQIDRNWDLHRQKMRREAVGLEIRKDRGRKPREQVKGSS